MPSPIDDPDAHALGERLQPLSEYPGLSTFPSEDDTGHGPEPVVHRPWVVLSIGLLSLVMLAGALLFGGLHGIVAH
jgi:hypothetical protein